MAPKNIHCRVIVTIGLRDVVLTLVGSDGAKLDEDEFGLRKTAKPIDPQMVARDVYSLLYQCANDAVNNDED